MRTWSKFRTNAAFKRCQPLPAVAPEWENASPSRTGALSVPALTQTVLVPPFNREPLRRTPGISR